MSGYVIPFAWGLAVLAAFVGWGGVVARLFGEGDRRPDWGLAAGWGMAAMLALGGALALVGLARPWPLVALVVAGAALFARDVHRQARAGAYRLPADRRTRWLIGLALVALLGRYASAVTHQALSCSDDDIAYFAFVTRLLDTGSLLDPFSLRRLSAYGGQTFLQALVMVAGDADNAYLVDRGIAVVVAFGLVLGFFRERGRGGEAGLKPVHYLLALLLTVVLPLPLLNSSSHVGGLAMFLALFRTLERAPRRPWLIGLVAAGAASLKATFLVMAAATLAAWWLIGVWRDDGGRRDWRRHAGAAARLAAASAAFLAPWMALMVRSSGTPLFPLIQGTHRPDFAATYSGHVPAGELLQHLGAFAVRPEVGLFVAPIVLFLFARGSAAALALYLGALATVAATVATLTYDTTEILHRYVAPFLDAAFFAAIVAFADGAMTAPAAAGGKAAPARRLGDGLLWLLVVALLPVPVYRDAARIAGTWGHTALTDANRAAYRRMQAAVPAGVRLMVMVNHPFALDFARNDIVNVDVPGGASAPPGMPFFQGPEALRAYLKAQSVGAVAFRDFDRPGGCLYGRDLWTAHARGANPMWRAQSKYYLDLMDNVSALATGGRVLYRRDGLTAVGLD